jgi:SAM-dependent MidA family methyltransferase
MNVLLKEILHKKSPMLVQDFLQTVLYSPHGYYAHAQVVGAKGDFITSPEISQCFGDLIALFFSHHMKRIQDTSCPLIFCELGPGRGTFLNDALRIFAKFPDIYERIHVYVYECSDFLKTQQKAMLHHSLNKIHWISDIQELPPAPTFVFANEFFDALPIAQTSKGRDVWVKTNDEGALIFSHDRDIEEIPHAEILMVDNIMKHIKRHQGGMLVIDYGYIVREKSISTLQALYNHRRCDVFDHLGHADLSHHVDFMRLFNQLKSFGLHVDKPITQRSFLENLGISPYTHKLLEKVPPSKRSHFLSGVTRLISPQHMGEIFKVLWGETIR